MAIQAQTIHSTKTRSAIPITAAIISVTSSDCFSRAEVEFVGNYLRFLKEFSIFGENPKFQPTGARIQCFVSCDW